MNQTEILALAKLHGATVYTHRTMLDNPSVAFGNMAQLTAFVAALNQAKDDDYALGIILLNQRSAAALAGSVPHGWQLAPIEPPIALETDCDLNYKLVDQLKQQAQIHAQEARTANATIAEIYQLCTGATGEPGNWHGAEPVRSALAAKDAEIETLRKALGRSEAHAHVAPEPAEPVAVELVGHLYTIAGVQHCVIERELPDGPLYVALRKALEQTA